MPVQIDARDGAFDARESAFGNGLGRSGEGDHGAVVIGIHLVIEEDYSRRGLDCGDDFVHLRGIPAFGEVRNALDELSQERTSERL